MYPAGFFPAAGQSLDERLDEDRLLEGLAEFQLTEVLDHYNRAHPAAGATRAALRSLASLRMRMLDARLEPARRLEHIERVLAARARLIDESPFDPRRGVWLADQASDLFFVLYPTDATWLTAEFGLPTPAQHARSQRIARDVSRLAAEAEIEIIETILNLESEPGFERNMALQLERRRLARDERDRRIPFLRGVGLYLDAILIRSDQAERDGAMRQVISLLEPLQREVDGGLRVRLRLYLGLAHAHLGEVDAADEFFRAVARDEEATDAERFAARMGGVTARRVADGADAALAALDSVETRYESGEHIFFRMLIADRRFMLLRDRALTARGSAREEGLIEAFSAYTRLLDADLGVPRDTARAIIFTKLASAADADMPLDHLPPIVSVARAENLSRDEQTRDRAIELFIESLDRPDLEDSIRAAALFGLARALYDRGDHLDAAGRFDQIAREFPRDPQSQRAIELAATLFVSLNERDPESADISARLDSTLALMLERYPNLPSIDRWRYEAARLKLQRGAYAQARSLADAVPPGSEVWVESRFLIAQIARREAAQATEGAPRAAAQRSLVDLLDRLREPISRAAEQTPDDDRRALYLAYLTRLSVWRAEAHLMLGDASTALRELDEVMRSEGVEAAVLGEALTLRIRALQQLGRSAEAVEDIRALIDRMPARAGGVLPAMVAAMSGEVDALFAAGREDDARRRATEALLPLAEAMDQWMRSSELSREAQAPLELQIADAYRFAGRFDDALPRYDRILSAHGDILQALEGRAESLFGLARYAEAMGVYRRIADARQQEADAAYWQAELRMLQILDRADTTAEQKRRIVPRITRLRAADPALGGPRFQRHFTELELRHRGSS